MADREDESRRTRERRVRRTAGDYSARLARTLMEIHDTVLGKLELDEDLREKVDRARAVTAQVARRRAERTLAGDLRGVDMVELQAKLKNVEETGSAEPQLFHAAERWRTRLIEDEAAVGEFPGGADDPLPTLIAKARAERDTGKPPGAARALFRHVLSVLKAQAKPGADAATDDDDA